MLTSIAVMRSRISVCLLVIGGGSAACSLLYDLDLFGGAVGLEFDGGTNAAAPGGPGLSRILR